MRAQKWSVEDGQFTLKYHIPTSDIQCFFGDTSDSQNTLDDWSKKIKKSLSEKTLKKHLDSIELKTGFNGVPLH